MSSPNSPRASQPSPTSTNAPSKPLVIKYWMTASPHSIRSGATLSDAHALMRAHNLRHLPVLEGGKLVGVLSQRDLYFLRSIEGVNLDVDRVEEAMSQEVYCVAPEARLEEVVVEMADHKYGCAVVVEGTKVVGVFTTIDALRLLAEKLKQTPS